MGKFTGNALKKQTYEVYLPSMGEKVKIALTMGAIAELEEQTGGLQQGLEAIQRGEMKSIASFLACLLSAGENDKCTAEWVLNNLGIEDIVALSDVITNQMLNNKSLKKLMGQKK